MPSSRRALDFQTAAGLGGLGHYNQPIRRPGVLTRTLPQDIEDAKKFSQNDLVTSQVLEKAMVVSCNLTTGKIKIRYLEGKCKGQEMDCKPSFFTITKKANA